MRVATDIGGTFTDLVYVDNEGKFGYTKSPTTPPNFEEGVINVLRKSNIPFESVEMFIHGSTVVINTLTERKGVKVGLLTTKGTKDVLEIARGNRPDLYNFKYQKPAPFVERHLRYEIEERLDYKGNVITKLNTEDVKEAIAYFKKEKVEAIAICFLHSYVNWSHEEKVLEMIQKEWPEVSVSASFEVTKEWREYERTNTTALNAYVKPIAGQYIDQLSHKLSENELTNNRYIMQSNGGVTTFDNAKTTPIHMVESGPVGGIYGAAILGELIGEKDIIAFDIGGTTAKCSLISNGEVKVTTDYYIEKTDKTAGYLIKVPVVDIVEIGNGGGSIAWIDELGSLKVGPQSAGSTPGPVAYGLGGKKPTTTDANLLVGRLSKENFDYDVEMKNVESAISQQIATHFKTSVEEAALGIIDIANSNMLNALKLISIRKGYNPKDFTLVAFGGGGPLHAAELAQNLGVKKVVVPVSSSVFSAWGMLMTDLRHDYIQTHVQVLKAESLKDLLQKWTEMEDIAYKEFEKESVEKSRVSFVKSLDLRYAGQEHTVKIGVDEIDFKVSSLEKVLEEFHRMHEQTYSFNLPNVAVEVVNLHLTSYGFVEKPKIIELEEPDIARKIKKEVRQVYFHNSGWTTTPVYKREQLPRGFTVEGPVIIEEQSASTVILEKQQLTVDAYGNLLIEIGGN